MPTGLRAGALRLESAWFTISPLFARFVKERAERRLEMEDRHMRIGIVHRRDRSKVRHMRSPS